MVAVATTNQDALTVAKFCAGRLNHILGFLTSSVAVAKALCMEHKLRCLYPPQSQGMVERANGTIKQKVTKVCESSKLNLVQALPLTLMKMPLQNNHTTHLTPHEMLTGIYPWPT